jgi:hypothetical protein
VRNNDDRQIPLDLGTVIRRIRDVDPGDPSILSITDIYHNLRTKPCATAGQGPARSPLQPGAVQCVGLAGREIDGGPEQRSRAVVMRLAARCRQLDLERDAFDRKEPVDRQPRQPLLRIPFDNLVKDSELAGKIRLAAMRPPDRQDETFGDEIGQSALGIGRLLVQLFESGSKSRRLPAHDPRFSRE